MSKAPAVTLPAALLAYDLYCELHAASDVGEGSHHGGSAALAAVAAEAPGHGRRRRAPAALAVLWDHTLLLLAAAACLAVAIGPAQTQGMHIRLLQPGEKLVRALHAPAAYATEALTPPPLLSAVVLLLTGGPNAFLTEARAMPSLRVIYPIPDTKLQLWSPRPVGCP